MYYYSTSSQSAPLTNSGTGDRIVYSGMHSGTAPLSQGFSVSSPPPGTTGMGPMTTATYYQPQQPPVYFSFSSAPPPPTSFVHVPFGGAPLPMNMCEGVSSQVRPWPQAGMAPPPPPPGFYGTPSNAPQPQSHYPVPVMDAFNGVSSRTNKPTTGPPSAPPTATVDDPAPCEHNNWDNLRAKNSVVTLCCRDCQRKWKQQFPIRNLCPEFHMRLVCAFGSDCPFLHVHRFKSITKSPNPAGHVVGAVRDKVFAALAIEVLAENPGKEPRDVVEEVRKRRQAVGAAAPESRAEPYPLAQDNAAPKPASSAESGLPPPPGVGHGVRLPSMLPASFFPFESQREHWNDESSMSRDSGASRSLTQGRLGDSSNIIGSQLHASRSGDALPAAQALHIVRPAGMMSPFPTSPGGQAQALHPVQLPNGQVVYLVAPAHLEIAPVTQLSLS